MQWNIHLGALWWCNGQIKDLSDDEIGAPWWPDGKNWGSTPLILFKRFNTVPLHSFKRMGPKVKLRNIRCHASWRRIHGALVLHCSSYISKIVWWLSMFDFEIFCHRLKLMGIHQVGVPSRHLKKFVLSFLFFLLLFWGSLSWEPLSSGAHGHCPPMPPSRYATGSHAKD